MEVSGLPGATISQRNCRLAPSHQAERKRQQRTRGKGPSRTESSVHCYGFYRATRHAVPLPPSKVGAQHPKPFPPLLSRESLSGV